MGQATLPFPRPAGQVARGALGVLSDDRLCRLASEGSAAAFTTIYERYHQGLYRYCHSILGNEDEAKDALQNTMVSALRALPGEQRKLALKPWLFRVAHNEAISVLRRRSPDTPIDDLNALPPARDEGGVREEMRGLMDDLRALPTRQRGALLMRELSGLSYSEIGAALGASGAAAKQLVYEARSGLRELEEGREMECETALRTISERDGRMLRGRKLRAHIRSCQSCRAFESSIGARRASFQAMAPTLSSSAAAAILEGIIGGGGSGGGGALAGLAASASGKSLGSSAALKAASVVVAAGISVAGAGIVLDAAGIAQGAIDQESPAAIEADAHRQADAKAGKAGGDKQAGGRREGDASDAGAGGRGSDGRKFESKTVSGGSARQPGPGGGGITGVPASGYTGVAAGAAGAVDQAVGQATGTNPGLGNVAKPVTDPVDQAVGDTVDGVTGHLPKP